MALIKYGQIVAEARGKLAGTVFSRNSSGAYMRQKVTPINPNTSYQQAVRADLSDLAQTWRTLTDTQRQSWIANAPLFTQINIFGDNMPLTGFQLYMKLNRNLQEIGAALITSAPSPDAPDVLESIDLSSDISEAALNVTFAPSPVPAGFAYLFYYTAQQSPGKNFAKSEFRYLLQEAAAAVSPALHFADYTARFGALVATLKVFLEVYPINIATGVPGPGLRTSAILLA